jgi:hydrogenase nickel incorporation protein HypB
LKIPILQPILEVNDQAAAQTRRELRDRGIVAINLISAPGAGKTALLEKLLPLLAPHSRVAVIEGDIATSRDAERIGALGVPVVQLVTGGECHLDATFVRQGLAELPLDELDLILIENVGNIACPAEFDLGEEAKVAITSVTEGHDKPAKYPLLFHEAAALVLNKVDLQPYTDFDRRTFEEDFRGMNASAPLFPMSCRTGEGVAAFGEWVAQVGRVLQEPAG